MTANIDYTSPSTNFTYDVNKSNFFRKDAQNYINVLGIKQLNTLENTITFSSQDVSLIEGTFNVIVFNETTFTLNQQVEEIVGDLTVRANVNLSLERR